MVCREIIPINKKGYLCAKCGGEGAFTPITGKTCAKCSLPLNTAAYLCSNCNRKTHSLESNYALFLYEGRERELILNLKYHFGPSMMKFIKQILKENINKERFAEADYIIAVPMYKRKEKERGYNQAHLLAGALSEITGIPVLTDVLLRQKDTAAQSKLNYYARQKNVSGVFSLGNNKNAILSKAILLVDDIYTTGSTMNECSVALLSGGAKIVNGFTFCVAANQKTDSDSL
jgi:ComF family protein